MNKKAPKKRAAARRKARTLAAYRRGQTFRLTAAEKRLVANLSTPEDCQRLATNALAHGRQSVANAARGKGIELRAAAYGAKTPVEQACAEAICAYEDLLNAGRARRVAAAGTRRLVRNHGLKGAVERAVNNAQDREGYRRFVRAGLQQFSFEAVVMRFPNHFSDQAKRRAESRMAAPMDESAVAE